MTCSTERERCSYLNPLNADAVEEFAELVRRAGGPREAARRMHVSAGHVVNIVKGRRQLLAPMLARARNMHGRTWGRVETRLLSAQQWQREHGEPYPYRNDDDDYGW